MKPAIITILLNQTLNLIWTFLAFIPVFMLWYANFNAITLLTSILLSLILTVIIQKAGIHLPLSNKRQFYEKLGVKQFQKFTQDSYYISKLAKKTGGKKSFFRRNNYSTQIKKIRMYEQYHLLCFLFFSFSSLIGIYSHYIIYAMLVTLANIIYNIIPLLIQQYNRIRLAASKMD